MPFEVGLMTGTFYDLNILEALQRAYSLGFSNVELLVSKNHFDIRDMNFQDRVYEEIVRLNLKVSSVHVPHTPYWPNMDISLTDESLRLKAVEMVKHCVDFMARFYWEEKRRIVLHPGGQRAGDTPLQKRAFYRSMNEILNYAASKKVYIALENMLPHLFGGTPEEFLEICTPYMKHWNFGVCFDTSHANLTGQIYAFLEELMQNFDVLEFHLSDNNGERDDHLLPFNGTIDWYTFFSVLRKYDGRKILMFEINAPAEGGCLKDVINETLEKLRSAYYNAPISY